MTSALVLAAGLGTRMGHCKPLLRIGGRTILQHTIDRLKEAQVDEVIVVLGHEAATIRTSVPLDDVKVIENPEYAQGMSTSIHAGLSAVSGQAEAALIALADQPFVRSTTISRLVAVYEKRKPGIVFPVFKGFRGNPVLVARRLFPELMRVTGDVGCRVIFDNYPNDIERVQVDDPGVLMDIDTPEELEKAARLYRNGGTNNLASTRLFNGNERVSSEMGEVTQSRPSDKILAKAYELSSKGERFAMATVVRAEAPTSAKPGNKTLIFPDGKLLGWVGGVCSQATVVEHGLAALADGKPRLLRLSSGGEDGESKKGIISVRMTCYSGGAMDIYVEPFLPQPRLLVIGREPIALALTRLAKAANMPVDVVEPLATKDEFSDADTVFTDFESSKLAITPQTFVVVATHGRFDEQALEHIVNTNASYVALVASRRRSSVIIDRLRSKGVPAEKLSRIKAPAGLDIGGITAEEIAVSIMAEIVSIRRRATGLAAPSGRESKAEQQVVSETVMRFGITDPVCGMAVDPIHPSAKVEYSGQMYFFCCESCAEKFRSTPSVYARSS